MACQLNIKLLLASVHNLTVLLISIILFCLFPGSDIALIGMIKNIIVTLQIRNKPFAQKLIRLPKEHSLLISTSYHLYV